MWLGYSNTLDGMHEWAYLGASNAYRRVSRPDLAPELVAAAESAARV